MNRFVYCPRGIVMFVRLKNAWTLARSKSVKEVLTYLSLSQDFFLFFFFFPISRQKRYVILLSLPSGIERALRSCVTKREKCLEHRRTGRWGEGGCSPPKFWATKIFWAARENLGKARRDKYFLF